MSSLRFQIKLEEVKDTIHVLAQGNSYQFQFKDINFGGVNDEKTIDCNAGADLYPGGLRACRDRSACTRGN